MKKALLPMFVVVMCGMFIACASSADLNYAPPVLDKPNAKVIDSFGVPGDFEDNIKIHNNSSDSDMYFDIYVHDPKTNQWMVMGQGFLKGAGDTDTIDTNVRHLDRYRYFGIVPLGENDYSLNVFKRRNDLNIAILDKQ